MSLYSGVSGTGGGGGGGGGGAAPSATVLDAADARALGAADKTSGFHVMATGQIESGEFDGTDNLYCKFDFSSGPDWTVVHGPHFGTSQTAKAAATSKHEVVWNFPIDIAFKSTNAFGWPRLVLSVHSTDAFDRDIIQGYGVMVLPTVPGRYVRYVRMFRPASSSLMQEFQAWITGNRPQFFLSKFVAQGDGREVTRVTSTGVVKVAINIMTKDMSAFGYTTGGPPDSKLPSKVGAGARSSGGAAGGGGGGGGGASVYDSRHGGAGGGAGASSVYSDKDLF